MSIADPEESGQPAIPAAAHEPPLSPPPDGKDWTWVLDQRCPECGFDPALVDRADIAPSVRDSLPRWKSVLGRPDAGSRPGPLTWSPLEYGCHIRDVFRRFDERVRLMIDSGDPMFANWDQDVTALQDRYWEQTPAVVARQLDEAGIAIAGTFDSVRADQWHRPGRRSNGSTFTVESLGRYFLHDVIHHLHDVNA